MINGFREPCLCSKKLNNTTGRNSTWGVFKAYAFFFVFCLEMFLLKGQEDQEQTSFLKGAMPAPNYDYTPLWEGKNENCPLLCNFGI